MRQILYDALSVWGLEWSRFFVKGCDGFSTFFSFDLFQSDGLNHIRNRLYALIIHLYPLNPSRRSKKPTVPSQQKSNPMIRSSQFHFLLHRIGDYWDYYMFVGSINPILVHPTMTSHVSGAPKAAPRRRREGRVSWIFLCDLISRIYDIWQMTYNMAYDIWYGIWHMITYGIWYITYYIYDISYHLISDMVSAVSTR